MNADDFLDLYSAADPVSLDSLARQVMTHAKGNGLTIRTPRRAFTFARTDEVTDLWHVVTAVEHDDGVDLSGPRTEPEAQVRNLIAAAFAENSVRIDKEAARA